MARPALIICMGVAGSGKTTLAGDLAREFQLEFLEADDFHGDANRKRMASGRPLTDAMREPWIARLCAELRAHRRDCVMAYSGLRRAQRAKFRQIGYRTLYLLLETDREVVGRRMRRRSGHFMPPGLMESQYADFEPIVDEADVITIDASADVPTVAAIARRLVRPFLHADDTEDPHP
jgi:gluconokinase